MTNNTDNYELTVHNNLKLIINGNARTFRVNDEEHIFSSLLIDNTSIDDKRALKFYHEDLMPTVYYLTCDSDHSCYYQLTDYAKKHNFLLRS